MADARGTFFEMIIAIGLFRRGVDRAAELPLLIQKLHLSVFKMHKECSYGVITAENMTEEEKNIVRDEIFILFITRVSGISCFETSEPRALLSGMVIFRLEVVPVLLSVTTPEIFVKVQRKQCLPSLAMREEYLRRLLGATQDYSTCTEKLDNSSHALHEFAWWRADFKLESFGFINSTLETVSNYFLDEK